MEETDPTKMDRLTCKLKYFCSEVLQYRRCVDCGFCTDPDVVLCALFEVTVDTTNGKLFWVGNG